MSRTPITKAGELAIKEELSKLKFVERPKPPKLKTMHQ